MIKIVAGVVLMCVAGGAWFYLDCRNKFEQALAEQMHMDLDQARAEARKRAEARTAFESQVSADLTTCQASADKAHADYSALILKAAPIKRGVAVIPLHITDAAAEILASSKDACQLTHDTRLKNGQ